MADSGTQFNIDDFSNPEFLHALQQALPLLEGLVKIARTHLPEDPESPSSPCNECPDRNSCKQPCDALNSMLPGLFGGKGHGETTIKLSLDNFQNLEPGSSGAFEQEEQVIKLDRGTLKSIRKTSSLDVFEQYERCWGIFTSKQREVLLLRYREGKTIAQIAGELGKAPSTVCGLLKRAEELKQGYDDEQLQKVLMLTKRMRA